MIMTKNEIIAYLAGIADGESYIGIKKTKASHRPGCANPVYQERLSIRMTEKQAIKLFKKTLGGWSYPEKQYSPKRRPCFVYEVQNKSAAIVIRALLPFLRIKKLQALTVLRLTANKATAIRINATRTCLSRWGTPMVVTYKTKHSSRTLAFRERLWLLCKELNRGPMNNRRLT